MEPAYPQVTCKQWQPNCFGFYPYDDEGNLLNLNTTTLITMTIGTSCATTNTGAVSHSLASSAGWVYGGSLTRYFSTTAIADGSLAGFFPVGTVADFRPFFISVPTGNLAGCGSFTVNNVSPATNTTVLATPIPDTNGNSAPTPIVLQYQGGWTASSQSGH